MWCGRHTLVPVPTPGSGFPGADRADDVAVRVQPLVASYRRCSMPFTAADIDGYPVRDRGGRPVGVVTGLQRYPAGLDAPWEWRR